MKYIIFILPLCISFYLLSFAKYNWDRRNKMAGIGGVILAISVFALSLWALL